MKSEPETQANHIRNLMELVFPLMKPPSDGWAAVTEVLGNLPGSYEVIKFCTH